MDAYIKFLLAVILTVIVAYVAVMGIIAIKELLEWHDVMMDFEDATKRRRKTRNKDPATDKEG